MHTYSIRQVVKAVNATTQGAASLCSVSNQSLWKKSYTWQDH